MLGEMSWIELSAAQGCLAVLSSLFHPTFVSHNDATPTTWGSAVRNSAVLDTFMKASDYSSRGRSNESEVSKVNEQQTCGVENSHHNRIRRLCFLIA